MTQDKGTCYSCDTEYTYGNFDLKSCEHCGREFCSDNDKCFSTCNNCFGRFCEKCSYDFEDSKCTDCLEEQ